MRVAKNTGKPVKTALTSGGIELKNYRSFEKDREHPEKTLLPISVNIDNYK
jgi:hypothetical protein